MSESHIAVQHDIVLKPVCFTSISDTFSASSIYFHDNDVLWFLALIAFLCQTESEHGGLGLSESSQTSGSA